MKPQRIAIVGGGAKAAAIAAKAECLNSVLDLALEVVIFESQEIGAAWSGNCGYTDGIQHLCTPAERDIGFPYAFGEYGMRVAERMQKEFSWSAFKVNQEDYLDWVDRGRNKPTHREFAQYIAHCIEKSTATVVQGQVVKLTVRNRRWSVTYSQSNSSQLSTQHDFDAAVVTGPGPAAHRVKRVGNPLVFDGINFWSSLEEIEQRIRSSEDPIAIIGSGGTAAAIAGWLVSRGFPNDIRMIGNQAALFARVDNAFENKAFTDTELWESLSHRDRRSFTDRLTRGAVWSTVLATISRAGNISYVPGRATRIRSALNEQGTTELTVTFAISANPKARKTVTACVVVDATGFNAAWFSTLLTPALAKQVSGETTRMQRDMSSYLALPLTRSPPLHAPMLSQVVSPAYTSLMALGDMADVVLRPYAKRVS